MEKTNVVNAVGKGGETYLTTCQNKQELEKWLAEHKDEIIIDELKVIDKVRNPLLKIFSRNK
ncbi:hypothetical protein M670_00247 [Schinkia azotoformans MEV2011]|uniref:Uncharacterized protein n=1 Tax=Schinkia azotoformans MEV2011 TaxID=1348973 RepID=A0A072NSN0_SCHAZ|nr:hypothetical protein [Schinkia azotoformans]KEF40227.1 hypothetical protein M670_00247 [Schinkia azotoformans MEV2011]MEC1696463.1 hypothetical protein [Schinkia azotoformans]MEC1715150.1 hypothetical protein [Schinkia azotoformans]MEC1719004.1 hypothetical protein [Schinkia azotoformans]MEC1724134.1 hypothetical protein [Schinkia azotoformans]